MLYSNSKKEFNLDLFKNPTKSYRAAPFWAWNTELNKDELFRQIDILKEMGFGGFHIHSRTGMATPYLSEEFFELVKNCADKAKANEMLCYLYDEDRWPSGSAGGFVTKNPKFRQMYLRFLSYKDDNERNRIAGVYDISFDENHIMKSYKRINESDTANGEKWFAYIEQIESGNAWFNRECYVDTLNYEAITEFINLTHKQYINHLGNRIGTTVPSIFTDEPQVTRKNVYDWKNDDFMMPWTSVLEDEYKKKYNCDVIDTIPELFFELNAQEISCARYYFHEITTELFATAFCDQIGMWCKENGLPLTGHVLGEGMLSSQTSGIGEAMRQYRHFSMPGIDMLMAFHEFATCKQVQSMQRQKGAEGILCELDGVTNWDFDFRHHKLHGDWQAALGVTLRAPHLSWVSMNGEAKRDYPASINYQSAWYKKYHLIEDYFARLNTVLTRGKPICKVAVLHPIRNMWIKFGTRQNTQERVQKYDKLFSIMTNKLVKNNIDFDFISESNLEFQNAKSENGKLKVQNCNYDILIVPEMISLTSDAKKLLENAEFEVITIGDTPRFVDAKQNDALENIYCKYTNTKNIDEAIEKIEKYRDVDILEDGKRSLDYCSQYKEDGNDRWLFFAKATDPENNDDKIHNITIVIDGEYKVFEYNCVDAKVYKTNYQFKNGKTIVEMKVFAHDSILLKLSADCEEAAEEKTVFAQNFDKTIAKNIKYDLLEENVFLLDSASMKLDEGEFEPKCDILKKDNEFRSRLGYLERGEGVAQPWLDKNVPKPTHSITLKFEFESKIEYKNAILALEDANDTQIVFNNNDVNNDVIGWYVDKCIKKISLGTIKKGKNELIVKMPFGTTTNTEFMYILGNFGVYNAKNPYIDLLPKTLDFSDISTQGLLFYGGNIDFKLDSLKSASIKIPEYFGGMVEIIDNDTSIANIIYSPYIANISGKSSITLRYYGTRINTFGQLHKSDRLTDHCDGWYGPFSWRTSGDNWTNDYLPWVQGITKPILLE